MVVLEACYLYLSSHERGDIVLVFKDGECLQQILLKPFPVLSDLSPGTTCADSNMITNISRHAKEALQIRLISSRFDSIKEGTRCKNSALNTVSPPQPGHTGH